ncbi:hypothetical protein MRX96_037053 [Rhipicephalus microplus]
MVVNNLLLALACCAVASPQVAQHLALHKTKRPTTLPAPARTLAATLGTTEAPLCEYHRYGRLSADKGTADRHVDGRRQPQVFPCVQT